MTYIEKLKNAIHQAQSLLCAGLDPDPDLFPTDILKNNRSEADKAFAFCHQIIEQTQASVAAYKLNAAFFEALGKDAFQVISDVIDAIPRDKIVIADAKRGDVPHTARRYKAAFFDRLNCDAITLSPFMGMETLVPFLQDDHRAVYALTLTSNPGAADLMLRPFEGRSSLSEYLAENFAHLARRYPGTVGMVMGATQSDYARPVLMAYPEAPLLIPGIGAQGGSVRDLSLLLKEHKGPILVNVSRGLAAFDPDSSRTWKQQISHAVDHYKKKLLPLAGSITVNDNP